MEGKGGNPVGLGKVVGMPGMFGIEGCVVWRRWRAARLTLIMLENVRAIRQAVMMDFTEEAMAEL